MVRGNGGGGDPWVPVMSPPGGEGRTPSDPECQYSVSPSKRNALAVLYNINTTEAKKEKTWKHFDYYYMY